MQRLSILVVLVAIGCGGKTKESTPCQVVGEHLAVLDAGRMAEFMTEKDRKSRAERWLSACAPWTEEQRKCVLAGETVEAASRCTGTTATANDAADSKPAGWTLKAAGQHSSMQRMVFTTDGDIVAAGEMVQRIELGNTVVEIEGNGVWIARLSPAGEIRWARGVKSKGERSYVADLAIEPSGSIVIDQRSKTPPRYSRIAIAADGSRDETSFVLDGEFSASEIVSDGAVVTGTVVARDPCAGSTFPLHRIAATGEIKWSACNDKSKEAALPSGMRYLATDRDGRVALCGSFLGDAPSWGGTKAPATPTGMHAVVASFSADGKYGWSQYVISSDRDTCEGLAVTDEGDVVALVNTLPSFNVMSWKADGTALWTKRCNEIAPGDFDCNITALTTHGDQVVVAGRNGGRTVVSRLHARTGAVTQLATIEEDAIIDQLVVSATATVFGATYDVVIGTL